MGPFPPEFGNARREGGKRATRPDTKYLDEVRLVSLADFAKPLILGQLGLGDAVAKLVHRYIAAVAEHKRIVIN